MEEIYQNALRLMKGGLYREAAKEFGRIPEYRDSLEKKASCEELFDGERKDEIYASALKAALSPIVNGQEKAIALFKSIPGWRDSDEKIREAEQRIIEIRKASEEDRARAKAAQLKEKRRKKLIKKALIIASVVLVVCAGLYFGGDRLYKTKLMPKINYNKAMSHIDSGEEREAYYLLRGLDYLDSREQVTRIVKDELSSASIGSTVLFGMYEQDANRLNGREPIEWIVLEESEGKLLLISKYAIEARPIQTEFIDEDICWANCYLRGWLNGDFIDAAFCIGEQMLIQRTKLLTADNPYYYCISCKNTTDRLFLPDYEEILKYFPTNEDRLCYPTSYTSRRGAYGGKNSPTWWWLRTSGAEDSIPRTVVINTQGEIVFVGHSTNCFNYAVRPMLWVDLSK